MTGDLRSTTDAMILAAGLGTRLRPLTNVLPKPLVPIGDRSAIAHLVDALAAAGFARIVVNAHHLAGALEALTAADAHLAVSLEAELLGTAGGVRFARESGLLARDRVLVVNGDLFGAVPLAPLASAPCEGDARLLVAPAVGETGAGNVGVDANGHVVRLRRESVREGEVASFDYLGCALFARAALDALPPVGCLVGDVLLPRLRTGSRVEVLPFGGPWIDVGSVGAYLEANRRWLEAAGLVRFVAASASVQGARINTSVVLEGARVPAGASLERCVVWAGAEVPLGAHADMVFVPGLPPVGAR
jgi:mannose-1-phosphate guanylyltransferase